MSFQITATGAKRFNAKLKKISIDLNNKYSPELTKRGYKFATRNAPMDTGALVNAIQVIDGKRSSKLVLNQPNHPKSGKTRPYHLWMHGIKAPSQSSGGAGSGYDTSSGRYRPKSGIPTFMNASYDYMIREHRDVFGEIFRKASK